MKKKNEKPVGASLRGQRAGLEPGGGVTDTAMLPGYAEQQQGGLGDPDGVVATGRDKGDPAGRNRARYQATSDRLRPLVRRTGLSFAHVNAL